MQRKAAGMTSHSATRLTSQITCTELTAPQHEVVELKGLGHPDTLADALAEVSSIEYSEHCLRDFGAILHHNLDKLYIGGGRSEHGFGFFSMIDPVNLQFLGRASVSFASRPIDVRELLEDAALKYLNRVLPALDTATDLTIDFRTNSHSKYQTWFHPRSLHDLPELLEPTASDSVVVTAWAPDTPVERLVRTLENVPRELGVSREPALYGADVKVLARRAVNEVDVVMNVPVNPILLEDADDYSSAIASLEETLAQVAEEALAGSLILRSLCVNSSSSNPFAAKRRYLLGTGSCIECGEEGFVGRGNGSSGLIAVNRPTSVEAVFGKNPTYHSGKVYAIYAQEIARSVHRAVGQPCEVSIVAHHSDPLRRPTAINVRLPTSMSQSEVEGLALSVLDDTDHVTAVLQGRFMPGRQA
jgi:S-adenosylmethionine synthetase